MLWTLVHPLFRFSPRLCWGWRRWLLRRFGASVGPNVCIDPKAKIFIPWNLSIGQDSSVSFGVLLYNLGRLEIGDRVTISHRVHLCGGSHDCRDARMPLIKSPIRIDDDAWICADAFVGPNVHVGNGAVVGAASAAFKDVAAWQIVGGNPAREIGTREIGHSEIGH
ncbi:MAG: putative colanic acid biosynthesis acetyltransferase [Planctomycetota bacterium]